MPVVVLITWAEGRSVELKKKLVAALTEKIHDMTGVDPAKIIITIVDLPLANVGMNGVTRG